MSSQCRAFSRLDKTTIARCVLDADHEGHHHTKVEFFFTPPDGWVQEGHATPGITADNARRKLDAWT